MSKEGGGGTAFTSIFGPGRLILKGTTFTGDHFYCDWPHKDGRAEHERAGTRVPEWSG